MFFKYTVLIAFVVALFASYAFAALSPVLPAPGPIVATCNLITVNFASTTVGTVTIIFDKCVIDKVVPVVAGNNAFQLSVSKHTKLGANTIIITDPISGTSVTYPVTVVNGCRQFCEPCEYDSSSFSSSC